MKIETNSKQINPLDLQRLVDGELDLERTQQILGVAEANPEIWKTICSAFVENQLWKSEFVSVDSGIGELNHKDVAVKDREIGWSPAKCLSLAASIFLATSIGFLVMDSGEIGVPASHVSQQQPPDENLAVSPDGPMLANSDGTDLNQTPALYRMQLQDEKGNQFMDSELPLYSGGQAEAERWMRDISSRSNSLTRSPVDSGYQMERNLRYLSGRLGDGRRVVIPVHGIEFSPGQ
ncbi:MAG: hypothetical protein AAGA30_07085 [Planctomycetota bacterium]